MRKGIFLLTVLVLSAGLLAEQGGSAPADGSTSGAEALFCLHSRMSELKLRPPESYSIDKSKDVNFPADPKGVSPSGLTESHSKLSEL